MGEVSESWIRTKLLDVDEPEFEYLPDEGESYDDGHYGVAGAFHQGPLATCPVRALSAQVNEEEEEEAGEDLTPLDPGRAQLFRAAAARANYMSMDRPDLAFPAKELCRRMAAPVEGDIRALRRLCQYLLAEPRMVYFFRWQRGGMPPCKSLLTLTSPAATGRVQRAVAAS